MQTRDDAGASSAGAVPPNPRTPTPMTDTPKFTPPEAIELELGGKPVTIERVSARKASRLLAILRAVSKDYPEVMRDIAKFRTEYARDNTVEVPRGEAELRWGAGQPLVKDGEPILYPATNPDGSPHPHAGEPMLAPGPLAHMTEEAWEAAGQVIRRPKAPSTGEIVGAVLDTALEKAEDHVYRLLALLTIPNATVKEKRKDGTLKAYLDELVDDVLDDAYADELLELAVAGGELVEAQFVAKARSLGGRLGNALRLLGIDPDVLKGTPEEAPQTAEDQAQTDEEPTTPSSTSTSATSSSTAPSSRPTSSTDSGASSDGHPTPPSTSPSTSSEPSTADAGAR